MNPDLKTLRPGGDPRTFSDFAALREEMNKRFHPARPDIDWARAHGLCLSLFNQNGADLQTVAWFTITRQHQAGIVGLNEGLFLLQRLLNQYWQDIWPKQTHARVEILSTLSQQLIVGLRGNTPVYADLPALYQAESILDKIGKQLQTLELKHLTKIERLQSLLTTQARQLESTDAPESQFTPPMPLQIPSTATSSTFQERTAAKPISIKADATINPIPEPSTTQPTVPSEPIDSSKNYLRRGIGIGFLAGILISGIIGAVSFYTLPLWKTADPLVQVLPILPKFDQNAESILEQQLNIDKANPISLSKENLNTIDRTLLELESLSPIWAQQYGLKIMSYLTQQYDQNSDIKLMGEQWQKNININALPDSRLNQWAQGMAQLNALSQRLDSLDGKPRSYITGSELKTIIFTARQHFNQGLPLEEELRRLEELQSQGAVSESEYQRIDNHFKQLLNRYALLRQNEK